MADDQSVEPALPPGAIQADDDLVRSTVGLLRLSALQLVVFGPLTAAVCVVGFWLAVGSLPLAALTSAATHSFLIGAIVGTMTSQRKRSRISIASLPRPSLQPS